MGKESYKRVRKGDKSKKKLKTALKNVATKTPLPKGQNLTDTNFKVKKIVIKDQVRPHDFGEILYRKKLNISELAARLNHHNSTIKHEALDGLRELVTNHPVEVLVAHHIQVLEAVVKLVLDDTSSIRKSAGKIVSQILSAVDRQRLLPFFPSLNSYLLCGLTHIDKAVREDALTLMDACLTHLPELCEQYSLNLLTVCLDLISDRTVDSRTLSLNLDSSQAVTKWRIKVLERVRALVKCLLRSRRESSHSKTENETHKVHNSDGDNYFPIYTTICRSEEDVGVGDGNESRQTTVLGYIKSIVPLMLSMFLEVHPVGKSTLDTDLSTVIDEESCRLLELIVGITQSLWDVVELEAVEERRSAKSVSETLTRSLLQTLVLGRFPYSFASTAGGKSQNKHTPETRTKMGLTVNLLVARLVLSCTNSRHWDNVVPFLKNCFRLSEQLAPVELTIFADCVSSICREQRYPESSYFFDKVVEITLSGGSPLTPTFFKLLGQIALNPQFSRFHTLPGFERWLSSLPELLAKGPVPPSHLDVISKIAVRNFPAFSSSLDVCVEMILDNIPKTRLLDENRTRVVQWQMATLLHWVTDWDDELKDSLQPALDSSYWGEPLTKYLAEIVNVKTAQKAELSIDSSEPL